MPGDGGPGRPSGRVPDGLTDLSPAPRAQTVHRHTEFQKISGSRRKGPDLGK